MPQAKTLDLQHSIRTHTRPTQRSMQVAVMFGLLLEENSEQQIIPPIQLTLSPGSLVFITGVSGGGKSTLLRMIAEALSQTEHAPDDPTDTPSPGLVWSDRLPALPDLALVDALAVPEVERDDSMDEAALEQVTRWLSLAGLNDAAVMLRRPSQLSEGQRHRLRLAQAFAVAERQPTSWSVLLADEFGSTLDRVTANALARSVRRWVTKTGVCLVAATAHDDLLEALRPDVLVEVEPAGRCSVYPRL